MGFMQDGDENRPRTLAPSSHAGLTRVSILKRKMDCRIKSGNDVVEGRANAAATTQPLRLRRGGAGRFPPHRARDRRDLLFKYKRPGRTRPFA